MIDPDGDFVNHWGEGASVPDITQQETQLFFYFMAISYLDAGIEAIHFGQVELIAMKDHGQNYAAWDSLLARIRTAALPQLYQSNPDGFPWPEALVSE